MNGKNKIVRKLRFLTVFGMIAAAMAFGSSISASAAGTATVTTYSGSSVVSQSQYSTFEQAWNAAKSNKSQTVVITVGGDEILSKMLELGEECKVTIDLNGYCLRRNLNGKQESEGGLFIVNKKAKLTIKDSRPKSTGYDGVRGGVLADGASSNTGGCFEIKKDGGVYIEGGTIYNCTTDECGGCANVDNGGFKMTGGRIYFCRTVDSIDNCHGGAIYMGGSTGIIQLSDCKIDNCYSEDDGGAVFSRGGTIKLNNVIFSSNRCRDYGGAICLWDDTDFEARNCYFVNNHTEDDGGAIYVDDAPEHDGPLLFESCIFRNNEADEDGGAIYVCDDRVALSNCEVTGNHAEKRGGGIFVESLYDISLRGLVIIKDNTCPKTHMSNLTLEKYGAAKGRVVSAGLYNGSYICIGTDEESGEYPLTYKYMSKYQSQYFHPDAGRLEFRKNSHTYISLLTSSLFGEGSVPVIAGMGAGGAVLVASVIIVKKKRDKKKLAAAGASDSGEDTEDITEGGAEHDRNDE